MMLGLAKSLRAKHSNGTIALADGVVEIKTAKGTGFGVVIQNTGGTNPMDVSFDGGVNFYPIAKSTVFELPVLFHSFYIRANTGTTTYSILMLEG